MFGKLPRPRMRYLAEFYGKSDEEVVAMLQQEREECDAYSRQQRLAHIAMLAFGIFWALAMTLAIAAVSIGIGSILAKHI